MTRFTMDEILKREVEFEVEAEQDVIEEFLDFIGDCYSSTEFYHHFVQQFGDDKVKMKIGKEASPTGECEFDRWIPAVTTNKGV